MLVNSVITGQANMHQDFKLTKSSSRAAHRQVRRQLPFFDSCSSRPKKSTCFLRMRTSGLARRRSLRSALLCSLRPGIPYLKGSLSFFVCMSLLHTLCIALYVIPHTEQIYHSLYTELYVVNEEKTDKEIC